MMFVMSAVFSCSSEQTKTIIIFCKNLPNKHIMWVDFLKLKLFVNLLCQAESIPFQNITK